MWEKENSFESLFHIPGTCLNSSGCLQSGFWWERVNVLFNIPALFFFCRVREIFVICIPRSWRKFPCLQVHRKSKHKGVIQEVLECSKPWGEAREKWGISWQGVLWVSHRWWWAGFHIQGFLQDFWEAGRNPDAVCVFLVYLNIKIIAHMPPEPRAVASVNDGGEF